MSESSSQATTPDHQVGFFVTCLVNSMRPNIAFAAIQLLREHGCTVEVPAEQSCCGQPAYNSGDDEAAIAIAKQVISRFEKYDYMVLPSGSCAAMVIKDYPKLFASDARWQQRARKLADKTHELLGFMVDVLGLGQVTSASVNTTPLFEVAYHDSCSGLRELSIHLQPRVLLQSMCGIAVKELDEAEVCCGFGGTFCVTYPEISARLVDDKIDSIQRTGATTVVGGDLGCLLNIAGRLSRREIPLQVFHTAEVLAGRMDGGSLNPYSEISSEVKKS